MAMARPTITSAPSLDKRHFYECAGLTLSWENEWYTQPWFTSARASYDRAASTGPVDPPLDIYETVRACSVLLSVQSVQNSRSSAAAASGAVTVTTTYTAATSAGTIIPTTWTSTYTTTPSSPGSLPTSTTLASVSASASTSATTGPLPGDASSSTTGCAGEWDFQAWGMVASLGMGILVGGLLWLLWGILRPRIPAMFAPRTWFLPLESRPSKPWSLLGFLLPFLHLPSMSPFTPLSLGLTSLHAMLAALKLAATSSLLALAAALPMFTADVPCLAETSPSNPLGGRLGTLTDLSLLRLLNALDPSPNSAATSSLLRLQPYIRALPSTIEPAISSARIRLIVLLVIIAVLGCGGGLFVVARTYAAFSKYDKHYLEKICGGLDMVVIPAAKAVAWKGMSEEGVKKWLRGYEGMEMAGVFAISDTSEWKPLLVDRARVLEKLEEAERGYIRSIDASQSPIRHPPGVPVSPAHDDAEPDDNAGFDAEKAPVQSGNQADILTSNSPQAQHSRFHEINRDSALYGKRFSLGQRIKIDEHGQYISDPSPESEGSNPLSSTSHVDAGPTQTLPSGPATTASAPPIPTSPVNESEAMLQLKAGPGKQPEILPTPAVAIRSASASATGPSPTSQRPYDLQRLISRLKELNAEVEGKQQSAFAGLAKGEGVLGWLVVGKSARFLPVAERIEGSTREDILWQNVGKVAKEGPFWLKVIGLGVILAAVVVPFIGLTVASAPGFAHYLEFLGPVARSDGFGSGVVQGLVPAIAMSVSVGLAVWATNRFAKSVRTVSRTRQRSLAYKATFHLLLFVTLFWLLTVAALEFGVQGLAQDVQAARFVGDGSIYSTWFIFVALLNLAIILPGLYLLQPRKVLWRVLSQRKSVTPRQKFRRSLPTTFNPSYGLAPFLVAVFYACTLVFLFPLLAIPILLLLFLSMVANRYMMDYVFVERIGYADASLGLWTLRRFGWLLALQPGLYGLILLGRREWALGGSALAIAVIVLILAELLTHRRYQQSRLNDHPAVFRRDIDQMARAMARSRDPGELRHRVSDASMLARFATLLPGYSRLPPECPLPLQTEDLDDLLFTERAAQLGAEDPRYFHDPSEAIRGLVYPPEMIAPTPVIWLSNDGNGVAEAEAADLEGYHGLPAIVTHKKWTLDNL